jgi:asparagine synthase (glutamine-hydrolysing)
LGEKNVERLRKLLGKPQKKRSFWDECEIRNLTETLGIKNPVRKETLDAITMAHFTTVMDGNIFHCAERHFGIEYRHPFFDRELVEFALSLPPEMKYRNRTIKRILRRAMEGVLPEKIRQRRDKAEFSEIISQQIDAVDLDELLGDPHILRLGLLNREDIDECLEGYRSGKPLWVSRLWAMINVEYWYRHSRFDEEGSLSEAER